LLCRYRRHRPQEQCAIPDLIADGFTAADIVNVVLTADVSVTAADAIAELVVVDLLLLATDMVSMGITLRRPFGFGFRLCAVAAVISIEGEK
jgi:hypothetical protein